MPKGIFAYLRFKFSISFKSLMELFGLLAIIKTISSLFQKSIMEIYKQSRGSTGLVFSITSFQKIYVFSLMILIPNFLKQRDASAIDHSDTASLSVVLPVVSRNIRFLISLVSREPGTITSFSPIWSLNTFVYFTYLRVYPCLNPLYKASLHTLYCTSLLYHLLHNLNRFAFQFEHLLSLLEAAPNQFFERVISRNLSHALARRMLGHRGGGGAGAGDLLGGNIPPQVIIQAVDVEGHHLGGGEEPGGSSNEVE
jgi:hypothetical protein